MQPLVNVTDTQAITRNSALVVVLFVVDFAPSTISQIPEMEMPEPVRLEDETLDLEGPGYVSEPSRAEELPETPGLVERLGGEEEGRVGGEEEDDDEEEEDRREDQEPDEEEDEEEEEEVNPTRAIGVMSEFP